jgi:hypothetical protein
MKFILTQLILAAMTMMTGVTTKFSHLHQFVESECKNPVINTAIFDIV